MATACDIEIVSVTSSNWKELETLFGRAGADNGCWCQYWLLGAGYHQRDRQLNHHDLRAQARSRRAGMLARRDGRTVGWARLTPRSELPYLGERFASYTFTDDDPLSLACFFIHRPARNEGVMTALIVGAREEGRRRGTPVEAYPIDPRVAGATNNRFPGVLPAFLAAGFVEVGRLAKDRVVVRSD